MPGPRIVVLIMVCVLSPAHPGLATFTTFESGHVRPLAMSPDGSRLFAVNTPDGHLEIFSVRPGTGDFAREASVPVGLEPVAVAARSNTVVWVVNHLSDRVSVVDVGATLRAEDRSSPIRSWDDSDARSGRVARSPVRTPPRSLGTFPGGS